MVQIDMAQVSDAALLEFQASLASVLDVEVDRVHVQVDLAAARRRSSNAGDSTATTLRVTISDDMSGGPPANATRDRERLKSRALVAFHDGTMQRQVPIPIKVVNTDTLHYSDFYWTEWFDSDDPSTGIGDVELLHHGTHIPPQGHLTDVCGGTLPLAMSCSTFDGVPWQLTKQVFSMPCSLAGITCRNLDNEPDGCRDYRIQFYCPSKGTASTLPPVVKESHAEIAMSQSPSAEPTIPPTRAPLGGTAALEGRGVCDPSGTDRCPLACAGNGACKCNAGWHSAECESLVWSASLASAVTDENGTTAELVISLRKLPSADVECDVATEPASEGRAASPLRIAAGDEYAKLLLHGARDFEDDGDMPWKVSIGPCRSADRYFDGDVSNAVQTAFALTNRNVPFPLVKAVTPDLAHVSTGRMVTVTGENMLPNSTVRVGNITVSDWSDPVDRVWVWRWREDRHRSVPWELQNGWMLEEFDDLNITDRGNLSIPIVLEVRQRLNRTLCSLIDSLLVPSPQSFAR